MERILVTGFEPFGGSPVNPSWLAAQCLHGRQIGQYRVIAARLCTEFGRSLEQLLALLALHRPSWIICLGEAGGRPGVSLERVAINFDDARLPDNAGAQPQDRTIVAHGPVAYFTKLPIKPMLSALESEGVAAEVSQTAGTFVCNHLFYGLMHELATRPALAGTRGGFIHVPWLPSQGTPSMPLADTVRGLRAALLSAVAQGSTAAPYTTAALSPPAAGCQSAQDCS